MKEIGGTTELDDRFGIPGIASVTLGHGGLAKVEITSTAARGEMYLHGAHVTSWVPAGAAEVLFVSSQSLWESTRPIRGGVPVCFPWFSNKADDSSAPLHGFARTALWQLESIVQTGTGVTVSMFTESNLDTKRWWPADFRLTHRATFDSELTLELVVENTGSTSLRFEEALHSYYRVGNIETARLSGLEGADYLDKLDQMRKKTQNGSIRVTSETDRIYVDTTTAVEIQDPALNRRLRIDKRNSRSTVVWNPWIAKSKAMPDFGDDEWPGMVCVETCNVSEFSVDLLPRQKHHMQAIVQVSELPPNGTT